MQDITQAQFAAILSVVEKRMIDSIESAPTSYPKQKIELVRETIWFINNEAVCLIEGQPTQELVDKAVEFTN